MQIKTALVLCAGFGKRVLPITTDIPKPLIKYNNVALLENTINFLINLKIKSVKINTFYQWLTRLWVNSNQRWHAPC